MSAYIIKGGVPLRGTIHACGNKNSALPCIAATLLTDEPVTLHNVPLIEDVQKMVAIMRTIGVTVTAQDKEGCYTLTASQLNTTAIPHEHASQIRASILFAGPMLARARQVSMPPPGGDVIGRRRLDTHFLVLESLGASVSIDEEIRLETARRLKGCPLFLDEASVTATENAIMAAALAEGTTSIENAASEPHVQDLCHLLKKMGAHIEGIGSNILVIKGVKKLHGAEFTIGPDYMEIGSCIGLAAATKSEIDIEGVNWEHLKMVRYVFRKLGIEWEHQGTRLHIAASQRMVVQSDIGGAIPKIDDAPWPGFPPDLISIALVTATQVTGTVLIHEKMFESRMFFVDKLIEMGARIVLCDPHRAVISGPCRLHGSEMTSPDVRAGMAMMIAALCADGESIIHNIYQIERGYERLAERLRMLGAQITLSEH